MFDELWIETLGGPIHENVELLERLRLQDDRLYSITNFCDENSRSLADCIRSSIHSTGSSSPAGKD